MKNKVIGAAVGTPQKPSKIMEAINPDMYYTEIGMVEILPETTLTSSEEEPGEFLITENCPALVIGESYIVNWNGVEYTGTAFDVSAMMDMEGAVALLNDGANLDTGEGMVFTAMYIPGMGLMLADGGTATSVTVSITHNAEKIHQIPPKYIKDMYYDNGWVVGTEILAEETFLESTWTKQNTDPVTYNSVMLFAGTLEVGKKYYVTYNGVSHVFTAITFPGMDSCTAIGGFNLLTGSVADPTAPYELIVGDGSLRIISTKKEDVTVSIHEAVEDLHQIPPKYIKDMYYTEGDGKTEVFPETVLNESNMETLMTTVPIDVETGGTYTVVFNGEEYNCTAQAMEDEGLTANILGNIALMQGTGDTGEPFVLIVIPPESFTTVGMYWMLEVTDPDSVPDSITLAIYGNGSKIHKIPNKYLDLEWIPETVKADKTLYEHSTHFGNFPAETLSEKPFEIVEGKKYTVVWNDVEYKCIGHEGDFGTSRVAYIGTTKNGMWVSTIPDAVNTDVPFCFEWLDNGPGTPILTGDDGSMGYIRSIEKNIDVTVKVISSVETAEKLPPKFLPMDDIIQAVKDSIPTWEGGSY